MAALYLQLIPGAFATCIGDGVNFFSNRVSLGLTLCVMSFPTCFAQVPEAHVSSIPLKLSVDHATDIRFAHISTAEGLSQIRVDSIIQDDQGFLWFGTQYGLNRFDGYTFKVFVHEPNNPNSLSGVSIQALFKDRDGALWIGCEQSLDRLDAKTETFTHYPMPMAKFISQDRTGFLWVSTANGLFRLDQRSGNIRVYVHNANDPESLRNNDIRSAAEDRTGKFWVAGSDGMDEFDRASGHIKLHIPIRKPSRDFSFYEDRFGAFWIFYASGDGLARFDRDTNVLTYYSFHTSATSSSAYSGVSAMLEDRHGNLWLATQGSGLVKFDREHRRLISYLPTPGDSEGLAENRVTTLLEDREGCIWVALFGRGLQRFSPVPSAFQAVRLKPKEGGIGSFYEDSHRYLWIGTRPALYRVDASGKSTAFAGVKPGVPFDVISTVEDPAGFIWVGTFNNGLFRLDPKTRQWKNYRHNSSDPLSLSNDIVNQLLVDHGGTLWAATWDGLNRFDAKTERFTTFRADSSNRELIYLSLVEGPGRDLWLGTFGFGLQQFNPKTARFTIIGSGRASGSLSNDTVNSIRIARNGVIWLSTQNGLDKLDPVTRNITFYGVRDGLTSSAISCVLEDSGGKLWMSTSKGISSFDPSTKIFRNFSEADGLPGPEMGGWGACLRSRRGQMFFAGFSGATTFLPEAVLESTYAPPIVITDFRLLGNPQGLAADAMQHPVNSLTSDVVLSHKQTPFSLTFAALGYSNPQTNRYRYMLEGLDNRWNEVGSDNRSVTYTSLPAGTYHFRVQGATNSGQWSHPGAEIQIVILPPWWSTWWFRTTYALAALLVMWSFYRYRIRQIARQSDIRIDAQVNERTRIARDLHDTLLQTLHGLMFQFQAVRNLMPRRPDEAMRELDEAISDTKKALAEGRNAIQDLRSEPIGEGNFLEILIDESRELARAGNGDRQPLKFELTEEGERKALCPTAQNEIRRIALEILRNAYRHADAQRIEAEVRYGDQMLRFRIRDDGKGIDPEVLKKGGRAGHWGIRGVRERAERIGAQVDFWSEVGAGTEVQVEVPASIAYEKPSNGAWSGLFRKVRDRAQRSKPHSNPYRG